VSVNRLHADLTYSAWNLLDRDDKGAPSLYNSDLREDTALRGTPISESLRAFKVAIKNLAGLGLGLRGDRDLRGTDLESVGKARDEDSCASVNGVPQIRPSHA
jgi:hypothetical protein